MGWATQRGPRPRLVATSHRLASYAIVSAFGAALDLDAYPLRNLIRPRCAERAKPGRGQGGPVNITCVQYLLIQQFYAIHFAIHLVLPVVCDRESFLVVCECRDSDQS